MRIWIPFYSKWRARKDEAKRQRILREERELTRPISSSGEIYSYSRLARFSAEPFVARPATATRVVGKNPALGTGYGDDEAVDMALTAAMLSNVQPPPAAVPNPDIVQSFGGGGGDTGGAGAGGSWDPGPSSYDYGSSSCGSSSSFDTSSCDSSFSSCDSGGSCGSSD